LLCDLLPFLFLLVATKAAAFVASFAVDVGGIGDQFPIEEDDKLIF